MMNSNDQKYKKRHKTYRKKHVKQRNKFRKNNYKKSRPNIRKNKQWTQLEIDTLDDPMWVKGCLGNFSDLLGPTDRQIAKYLGRSVQAIQQKRYLIKKSLTDR